MRVGGVWGGVGLSKFMVSQVHGGVVVGISIDGPCNGSPAIVSEGWIHHESQQQPQQPLQPPPRQQPRHGQHTHTFGIGSDGHVTSGVQHQSCEGDGNMHMHGEPSYMITGLRLSNTRGNMIRRPDHPVTTGSTAATDDTTVDEPGCERRPRRCR